MKAPVRITVREAHGIRRFLYPLSAIVDAPLPSRHRSLALVQPDGRPVPLQVTPAGHTDIGRYRLDFAVSLAPRETIELKLVEEGPRAEVPDPLKTTAGESFRSVQERFAIELDRAARVQQVVYDGRSHMRSPHQLLLNGESPALRETAAQFAGMTMAARINAFSRYDDGRRAQTRAEITACKSWLRLIHTLETPRAGDRMDFVLPLAVSTATLTCDFGAGGGIYGKLDRETAPEIFWRADLVAGRARWSLHSAGRIDFEGVAAGHALVAQRWFHRIDRDKSLAVAITDVPAGCRQLLVTLNACGDVTTSFCLGGDVRGPASFGLCYHFLNDIPPVSAATNPQSILFPPMVRIHKANRRVP